jgi:hypothetical protein
MKKEIKNRSLDQLNLFKFKNKFLKIYADLKIPLTKETYLVEGQ